MNKILVIDPGKGWGQFVSKMYCYQKLADHLNSKIVFLTKKSTQAEHYLKSLSFCEDVIYIEESKKGIQHIFLNIKSIIKNIKRIIKEYDHIVDGSDNFKTKFLLNDSALKFKKFLVTGAISKFDGHLFTYNFRNKKSPCLRCFFQEDKISDDILNCEYEGVLGTVAGILGTLQANEILKQILNIGKNLNGKILILDLLKLDFRKAKIKKKKTCIC